ncbi:MAG: LolA family protein [Candidatus Sumerlaeota bacterium]
MMKDTRYIVLAFWLVVWVLGIRSLQAQDTPSTATLASDDRSSTAAVEVLKQIEKRHGDFKTLVARFEQIRIQEEFGDEIRSEGRLYLKMPGSLRCEYESPEPSVLLFTDNTFYQYVPVIQQVDKYRYNKTQGEQMFELLMLGFGVSSDSILESYVVKRLDPEEKPWAVKEDVYGLSFRPLKENILRDYSRILVWIAKDDLLPVYVRLLDSVGSETNVDIKQVEQDVPVSTEIFQPDFSKGVDIIDHTESVQTGQ